jgi:ketosteroid isomerase-like protein
MGRKTGWIVGFVAALVCLVAGSLATFLLLRQNGLATRGTSMEASDRDIQEVERLERSFGEAITRGDAAALDRLMADDFVGTNPLARVLDKKQTMAELASPDYELQALVNEDIRVRLFGDVAVATARGTAKGRYKGQDASGQFRYTRAWVKREGQWQAVAAQATMIPG